jgi:hypothetical protein
VEREGEKREGEERERVERKGEEREGEEIRERHLSRPVKGVYGKCFNV